MVKLKINRESEYMYILTNEQGKAYVFNLEFRDIEKQPQTGDYIFMNEMLLDKTYEGYSSMYTFGSLDSVYGRKNLPLEDIDVIKIVIEDVEIYLKRLYG